MQDQLSMALWHNNLADMAELIYIDAPHAAKGASSQFDLAIALTL